MLEWIGLRGRLQSRAEDVLSKQGMHFVAVATASSSKVTYSFAKYQRIVKKDVVA